MESSCDSSNPSYSTDIIDDFRNASLPMTLTLLGIFMVVSSEHPRKAFIAISSRLLLKGALMVKSVCNVGQKRRIF